MWTVADAAAGAPAGLLHGDYVEVFPPGERHRRTPTATAPPGPASSCRVSTATSPCLAEQRPAALSHCLGCPYALHVCGNTNAILADLATTGADALELDYKTDVRLAHDLMKDSTVFIGNLDPSSVVALGAPALVETKSRELIALFGDTRRFILNAGCAIPATAPEANIRAMVHAARSW